MPFPHRILPAIFLLLSFSGTLSASSGLPVLRLPGSARSAASADTLASDIFSLDGLDRNPTAGAELTSASFLVSHAFWLDTFSFENASALFPTPWGNAFVSFRHFYTTPFKWIGSEGEILGDLNASDSLLSLGFNGSFHGFSRGSFNRPRYGAALKILYSRLQDYSGATACLDTGASFPFGNPATPFILSLALRNLGVPLSYGTETALPLPLDINAGLFWTLANNTVEKWSLNASANLAYVFASGERDFSAGLEIKLDRYVRVGAGYRFLADTARFTMGAGLFLPVGSRRIEIAMAYLPEKTVSDVFLLSAGYKFGYQDPYPVRPELPSAEAEDGERTSLPENEPAKEPALSAPEDALIEPPVASSKPRIHIAGFEFIRLSSREEKDFQEIVADALNEVECLLPVMRSDLGRFPPVFDPTFCRNANCASAFARKAGVDAVITGKIEKNYGQWIVSLDIVPAQLSPYNPPPASRQFTEPSRDQMASRVMEFIRDNAPVLCD